MCGMMDDFFHSRFAETLGWALVHSLWQIAAVAVLSALVLMALRRASANMRYAAACAGFLLMVAVPVGTYAYLLPPAPAAAPGIADLPIGPPHERMTNREIDVPLANQEIGVPREPLVQVERPWTMRARRIVRPLLPWAEGIYLAGMMILLARLAAGYGRLRGFVGTAVPIGGMALERMESLARRMGVKRAVRLLESAAIEVPTLLGAIKPAILLPAAALAGLSVEQLEALLAHELAHIRRHDYLFNLVQSFLETLLFYHPAAWWLSARIRQEREHCCDDAAVTATRDRVAYARALAAMETLRIPGGMALAAGGGRLLPRIKRILEGQTGRAGRRGFSPAGATPDFRFSVGTVRLVPTTVAAVAIVAVTALIYIGCSRSDSSGASTTSQANTKTETSGATASAVAAATSTQPILVEVTLISIPTQALEEAKKKAGLPSKPATAGDAGEAMPIVFGDKNADAETKFLTLVREDQQADTIFSPRMLLNSGQQAAVTMGDAMAEYVKGFKETATADGRPPKIEQEKGQVPTRMTLAVTATLADGKIALDLRPKISLLQGMDMFYASQADWARGAYVQVPKILTAEFQTHATIPDGGMTVMMGKGVKGPLETASTAPGLSPPTATGSSSRRADEKVDTTIVVVVTASMKDAASGIVENAGSPIDPQEFSLAKDVSPADLAAQRRLNEVLQEFSAQDEPLEKVLDRIRDDTKLPLAVDWDALNAAGIKRDAPITVSLSNNYVWSALKAILSKTGSAATYGVKDGLIRITTGEQLSRQATTVVRSFDVRDMIMPPTSGNTALRKELVGHLIDTIQSTVAPDTWESNGGKIGTISEKDGRLIVKQTKENMLAVYVSLRQLGVTRALDIAVEGRTLLVSDHFLNDFRIGWDSALPVGNAGVAAANNTSIIDNWTLNLLQQAVQADKRSINMWARRLTVPNGYPGRLVIGNVYAATAPATSGAPDGADLPHYGVDVVPTASADRRYVVMTLGRIAPTGEAAVAATGAAGAKTMVSVLDGATLLIDGGPVTIANGPAAGTYRALILLRPNLVIHGSEPDLFGPGYDRPTGLPSSTKSAPATTLRGTTSAGTIDSAITLPAVPTTIPDERDWRAVARAVEFERAAFGAPAGQPLETKKSALAGYKANEKASDDALARGEFRKAITMARLNGTFINNNRKFFTDAEVTAMREAAEKQAASAEAAETQHPEGEQIPLGGRQQTGIAPAGNWELANAEVFFVNGQYKEAAENLEGVLKAQPDNPSAKAALQLVQKKMQEEAATQPATTKSAGTQGAMTIRHAQVAALIADAHKLYEAAKYKETADLLRQAVLVDPQDTQAQFFLRLTLDKITDLGLASPEDLIPYSDLSVSGHATSSERVMPLAPPAKAPASDFPVKASVPATDPTTQGTVAARADAALRDRLAENLKEVTADGQGLEKVLNFLRDNMGANVSVDWAMLEKAGITRTSEVTLSVKEISFAKALSLVLQSAGSGKAGFAVQDGAIVISTREALKGKVEPLPADAAGDKRANDALAENLKELTCDSQRLEKVLNFTRDNCGVNIFVDWQQLKAAGINKDTPVTLSVKEVAVGAALKAVLESAGAGKMRVYLDGGVVMITNKTWTDTQVLRDRYLQIFYELNEKLDYDSAIDESVKALASDKTLAQDERSKREDALNRKVALETVALYKEVEVAALEVMARHNADYKLPADLPKLPDDPATWADVLPIIYRRMVVPLDAGMAKEVIKLLNEKYAAEKAGKVPAKSPSANSANRNSDVAMQSGVVMDVRSTPSADGRYVVMTIVPQATQEAGQKAAQPSTDSRAHLIPYADLMVNPKTGAQYTGDGGESAPEGPAGQPAPENPHNTATRTRLDESVVDLSAKNQGLQTTINQLRDSLGANIFVNWTALQTVGIDKDTPVTLDAKHMFGRQILEGILAQASQGKSPLAYVIDDGIIVISTQDELSSAKYQVVRVFDMRNMLLPKVGVTADEATAQRAAKVKFIMELVKGTVAPESWRDNGGTIGSIRELNGQLIVNQTVDNQSAVNALLQNLRAADGPRVLVKTVVMEIDAKSGSLNGGDAKSFETTTVDGPAVGLIDEEGESKLAALAKDGKATIFDRPWLLLPLKTAGEVSSGQEMPRIEAYAPKAGAPGEWLPQVTHVKVGSALKMTPFIADPPAADGSRYIRLQLDWSSSRVTQIDEAPAAGTPPEKGLKTYVPMIDEKKGTTNVMIKDGRTLTFRFPGAKEGKWTLVLVTPTIVELPDGAAAPASRP